MKQVKEQERLDKVLSNNGFGTRKEVKHFIRSRVVTVNGEIVSDPDAHINVNSDIIAVNGVSIQIKSNIYLMMNKACGYVCSTRGGMHPIVYDLLKDEDHRKFMGGDIGTIGRLDLDTEGLLIFTSDGDLNHRLTSPKWRVPKTYQVYLRDSVSERDRQDYKEKLAAGVHIEAEGKEEAADCLPAELEWQDENNYDLSVGELAKEGKTGKPAAVCHLTVYEGKFHEVKRLFAALGNEVIYLKRLSVNGLSLDPSLEPGQYRELTDEEIKILDISEVNRQED